jgi:hypothetical protein
VLFVSNGPGNDPPNSALGRILSEQDIKVARIADERIAEAFVQLDAAYGQNIRTRLPTGGYASYHRPHFGLSSAPLSPILSVTMNSKG